MELDERLIWSNDPRCPHGRICGLLGQDTVAAMLDYVAEHEAAFKPGGIRKRGSGERVVDPAILHSRGMRGLGPFQDRVETIVRTIAPVAIARLGLMENAVEPREFEFASYGDGGHFNAHTDTFDRTERLRILSCVYYFAVTPPCFSGGELRLHGFPSRNGAAAVATIAPETDMMVMFPSWMFHEVLPVHVSSGAWMHRRFSINCWVHRAES